MTITEVLRQAADVLDHSPQLSAAYPYVTGNGIGATVLSTQRMERIMAELGGEWYETTPNAPGYLAARATIGGVRVKVDYWEGR